jgi:hypothetical protein
MLTDNDAMATIAVRNMAAARNFYEGKLHFKQSGGNAQGVTTYKSGNSTVLIYESQYAGTNKATAPRGASATNWRRSCAASGTRESSSSTTTCPEPGATATYTSSGISKRRGSRTPTATSSTSTAPKVVRRMTAMRRGPNAMARARP